MELRRFSPQPFSTSMKYSLDGRSTMRSSNAAERSCDAALCGLLKQDHFHDLTLADWSYGSLLQTIYPRASHRCAFLA